MNEPDRPSNPAAGLDDVMPAVYAELKRLAAARMNDERAGHTLEPTALVHEVYLRLLGQRQVDWCNRAQLLGLAARMMRRILLDHADQHQADKRWGQLCRVPLDDNLREGMGPEVELFDLERALVSLETVDPRQARVVELRFYGGLTVEETAEAMAISPATVQREWASARLWLLRSLKERDRM
jgi:RNA polymerase sigma factor (TIGR02999 family)